VKLQGVDQKGFINTLKHIGYQVREKEAKNGREKSESAGGG
jgi:hypothetical protein